MAIKTSLCLLSVLIFMLFVSFSEGYVLNVGGKDGWVLNPSESYSHWAQRLRFSVNDTLVFKFKKGEDSVLVVSAENYDKCNMTSPEKSLTDEKSEYNLEKSGHHYFISGNADHCQKGQKLEIIVLAVRPAQKAPPTPSPVPKPTPPPAAAPSGGKTPAPGASPQAPAAPVPAMSPSAAEGPSGTNTTNKNGASLSTAMPSHVFVSVAIGVGVFLGSFGGMI